MQFVRSDAPLQFRFLFAGQFGDVRVVERVPEFADEPKLLSRLKLKQLLVRCCGHARVPLSALLYHAAKALSTLPQLRVRSGDDLLSITPCAPHDPGFAGEADEEHYGEAGEDVIDKMGCRFSIAAKGTV